MNEPAMQRKMIHINNRINQLLFGPTIKQCRTAQSKYDSLIFFGYIFENIEVQNMIGGPLCQRKYSYSLDTEIVYSIVLDSKWYSIEIVLYSRQYSIVVYGRY